MEVCPFWKNSKKSKRSEKEIAVITKKKQIEDIILLTTKKDEELDKLLKLEAEVWLQRSRDIWLEGEIETQILP